MPTIYDVAKLASVSPATVSRVVNQRGNVRPDMASRVNEAIEALDYRPNVVARNLRRQTSAVWTLIFSDIDAFHFTAVSRGVMEIGQDVGKSVVLCNTDDEPDKEQRYIEVAVADRVAGVVISPASESGGVLEPLLELDIPVVTIDRDLPSSAVGSVLVENERGAEQATAHLLASGYGRIACITGDLALSTAAQRLAGYRGALEAAGLPYDPALVRTTDYREAGGYRAMSQLLELDRPPDAVFVANSQMTLGALECLADRGVSIPDEMGIVGFDEHPWARLVSPALTTVAQPTYELGRVAAQMLVERAKDPGGPPTRVSLPTELIVRESSTPRRRPPARQR
jgi:LacI family transcriptional regulator